MTTMTNTTKKYELTILMDEGATDKDIEAMTKRVERYGTVVEFEDDGVKRLAYPIQRERLHEKTRYLFYTMIIEGDKWRELNDDFNTNKNIIRYLLVRTAR